MTYERDLMFFKARGNDGCLSADLSILEQAETSVLRLHVLAIIFSGIIPAIEYLLGHQIRGRYYCNVCSDRVSLPDLLYSYCSEGHAKIIDEY
jgi:hypothetical protein